MRRPYLFGFQALNIKWQVGYINAFQVIIMTLEQVFSAAGPDH